MPLSRYQIRNEYSLADPELYRAAEKDDPESLLEGVAMAGLVGVLRQLGDLAEFAAELFHDLHEEVMVTAARGHSLIVRVQQLEAEIPSVEKAFLSQTTHSSFLYNPGIVWHPKIRVEQNLVMSGDLPRFIMDSYEECRGPPRLFLLDKFDVAGAGSCLKRYTDPSFFKLEMSASGTPGTDLQRERKIRKAKKKGSRWRNGETPEVLSMSHAKLHQLFLEERIENGITDPARRVKLRKRLNGFPFDTKSGKSYMERFFKSPLPDHNEVHDILVDSSPLLSQLNGSYEPVSEIAKIKTITLENESNEILTSPSPVKEETYQINLPTEKLNEIASGIGISDSGLQAHNAPIFQAGNSEKVFPVDGGSSESAGDYKSDDIGSEVEQYMDALTTIDSEIDTDTEFKAKSKLRYFDKRRQVSDFDVNDSQIQAISSESQSLGHSTLSDDGNSSSKKGVSIVSSSDTQCLSVPSDGEVSSIVFPCNHQLEVYDTTSIAQPTVAVKNTTSQTPGATVSDVVSTEIAEYPHISSELDNHNSDSIPLELEAYNKSTDSLETGKAPVGPEADKILPYMSLNTTTANTVQPPARDDHPSCNQFKDGFEVDNLETDATDENAPTHTNQNETDELEGEDLNLSPKASLQSNIYDVALKPSEDSSPETSGRNTPIGEFGSIQTNSFVEIATDKSYGQSPNCLLEARSAKDHHGQNSDESQLGLQRVVIPFTEEHHLDPIASELDNKCPSTGEVSLNATSKTDTGGESIEYVVQKAVSGLRSEQLKQGTSDSEEEHFERPSVTMDTAIMKREASCDMDLLETNCTSSPSLVGENLVQMHFMVPDFGDEMESVELTYNDSEIHSDSPLVRLKQDISGSEEEHIERFSDTEDADLRGEADCNLKHLEVDYTPILSLPGNDVKVHSTVPSDALERESIEDADGSSIDLKNSVEESLPGLEDEYIGPEAEKTFPLDEHQKSSVALNNISTLSNVDDFAMSGRGRSDDILDQHFASDNMLSDNKISVQSSAKQDECETSFEEGKVDSLSQKLDETLPSRVKEELLTQTPQILCSEEIDHVTRADALSEPMLESLSSQPLVSECLSQENNDVDVPGLTMSILSNSFLLPSTSHVTLEEMPPLPPLPPVQWRITKLQHDLPAQERLSVQHNAETFPQDTQLLNVVTEPSNLDRERSSPVSEPATEEAAHPSRSILQMAPVPDHGDSKAQEYEAGLAIVPHLPAVGASENHQMASRTSSTVDELRPWSEPSDVSSVASYDTRRLPSRMEDELPQHAIRDSDSWPASVEKSMLYTTEVGVRADLWEERLKEGSPLPQVNTMTDGTTSQQQPSMTDKDQPQHAVSTMVGQLVWPAVENDRKENGSVHVKLPRPRNPLIDAVVALDKSKLRKVTEHARPEVKKVDEKNSILEQIRTKSFNLKPAVVSRPSIQGPATNLKVAAILEKAKTIRQAFAGSDEDEDNDSWSDS